MTQSARPRRPLATSPFAAPPVIFPPEGHFEIHDRVTHDRFGLGRVIAIEASGILSVNFGPAGVKHFPSSTPQLVKL